MLVPFWGPKHAQFSAPIEYGEVTRGAVAAFKMEEKAGKVVLTPVWLSRDMDQAEPPVVAGHGVVFAYGSGENTAQADTALGLGFNTAVNRVARSTHATLYALDAHTGKELWSSGDQITSFNHFSGLSVANGRVYIGTYDGMLYCFAVGAKTSSAPAPVASAFRRRAVADVDLPALRRAQGRPELSRGTAEAGSHADHFSMRSPGRRQ